ncbi:MAG: hypothetical protein LBU45_06470, partial [Azoarcus sp.]|nr:hypothetical protein [Azoarcus sp.]
MYSTLSTVRFLDTIVRSIATTMRSLAPIVRFIATTMRSLAPLGERVGERGMRALAFITALSVAFTPVAWAANEAPATKPAAKAANASPGDVYFKQITLDEAARFISQIGKTSIVVTSSVANKVVSLYLRDVDVDGMVKNLCRAAGVWYRFDPQTKAYILMNAQEYQQDIAITRD